MSQKKHINIADIYCLPKDLYNEIYISAPQQYREKIDMFNETYNLPILKNEQSTPQAGGQMAEHNDKKMTNLSFTPAPLPDLTLTSSGSSSSTSTLSPPASEPKISSSSKKIKKKILTVSLNPL